jgi:hypothetical protein
LTAPRRLPIPDRKPLVFSSDELRELHLAMALRIAQLTKVNTKKMRSSELAKHQRHIDLATDLFDSLKKERRK